MKIIVNSDRSLVHAFNTISELLEADKYLQLNIIEKGKSRTLQQNALSHSWYSEVSKKEQEYTPGQVKCLCKYHFGLPILRGDDEDYNEKCALVIDPLSYENKIKAMEYWPVTSWMKTKQLSIYLQHVQAHYLGRVNLVFPDELKK